MKQSHQFFLFKVRIKVDYRRILTLPNDIHDNQSALLKINFHVE